MKILIIGGGIGGLTTAGFLEQKGFDVTLIERTPEFKNIGFGLGLFGNGQKILEKLGVYKQVSDDGHVVPWIDFIDKYGETIFYKERADFEGETDKPVMLIERNILHKILAENLKKTKVRLGTTLKKFEQKTNKVNVTFSDNTTDTFDLIIAADGINSSIRKELFENQNIVFYGWSVRSFWIPEHIPLLKGAVLISKENITLGVYPVVGKQFVLTYEYNPEKTNQPMPDISDLLSCFKKHGWSEKDLTDLINAANESNQHYDQLRQVTPWQWYKGRVVFLGDALHAFSPVSGMGASIAIEDSFVLAEELGRVQLTDIDAALTRYRERRTPRLTRITKLDKDARKVYLVTTSFTRWLRDNLIRLVPKKMIGRSLAKIQNGEI